MKKCPIKDYVILYGLLFSLFLSGCLSIPSSPASRFYTLKALEKINGEGIALPSGLVIGIGPIKIPDYLNRPQIVTREANKMLKFAEFDRWGENLDAGILRLINEDLALMLPQASIEKFPWNLLLPVEYQVIVEVLQIDARLDKDLLFLAQWSILDLDKKQMVVTKRSEFVEPINQHNYEGLAGALSSACAKLSSEIAGELAKAANHPES